MIYHSFQFESKILFRDELNETRRVSNYLKLRLHPKPVTTTTLSAVERTRFCNLGGKTRENIVHNIL